MRRVPIPTSADCASFVDCWGAIGLASPSGHSPNEEVSVSKKDKERKSKKAMTTQVATLLMERALRTIFGENDLAVVTHMVGRPTVTMSIRFNTKAEAMTGRAFLSANAQMLKEEIERSAGETLRKLAAAAKAEHELNSGRIIAPQHGLSIAHVPDVAAACLNDLFDATSDDESRVDVDDDDCVHTGVHVKKWTIVPVVIDGLWDSINFIIDPTGARYDFDTGSMAETMAPEPVQVLSHWLPMNMERNSVADSAWPAPRQVPVTDSEPAPITDTIVEMPKPNGDPCAGGGFLAEGNTPIPKSPPDDETRVISMSDDPGAAPDERPV
jgi:hypothetical protein